MTAEPNTSMTTDQALEVLRKHLTWPQTHADKSAEALSVLTQEIERLTERVDELETDLWLARNNDIP